MSYDWLAFSFWQPLKREVELGSNGIKDRNRTNIFRSPSMIKNRVIAGNDQPRLIMAQAYEPWFPG